MARSVLLFLICLSSGLAAQSTPTQLDAAIDLAGPYALSSEWPDRKSNADLIDLLSSNPLSFPVLSPGNPVGWALANLYRLRWEKAVARLATVPLPQTEDGLRLTHLYSSSWIIETPLGKIGIDVVEGPFENYGFAGSVSGFEIAMMATQLDALFITHLDSDHFSAKLVLEMLVQNKPVICPPDLAAILLYAGAPSSLVFTPSDGLNTVYLPNGAISYEAYNGSQRTGTVSQVDCNAYNIFLSSGRSVIHAGDMDAPGFPRFVLERNWYADFLVQQATSPIPHDIRFLSHELEYTHFGAGLIKLNMPLNGPMPKSRFVLIWGESVSF